MGVDLVLIFRDGISRALDVGACDSVLSGSHSEYCYVFICRVLVSCDYCVLRAGYKIPLSDALNHGID